MSDSYTDPEVESSLGAYQALINAPSSLYKGLEWASQNVALPALKSMNETYQTDWSNQPFIGVGEHGEFTGRLPALAGVVTPYLAGAAPGGSATLPAGVKLPGGKYGYPEGLEGGYHGTHTVFAPAPENQLGQFMDKFINTGEGAQAYGWGHYVGAKKGTGASYMPEADSSLHLEGQPWNPVHKMYSDAELASGKAAAEEDAFFKLIDAPRIVTSNGHRPDVDAVIADLKGSIASKQEELTGPGADYYWVKDELKSDQRALDYIQANKDKFTYDIPGSLYHVEIKPSEESLFHWDKKMKDQEPAVLEQMMPLIEKYGVGPGREVDYWMDKGGGELYSYLKRGAQAERPELTGNGQALSEAMKEAGIPGLRFADQQSRPVFQAKEVVDRSKVNIEILTRELNEKPPEWAGRFVIQQMIDRQQSNLNIAQKQIRDKSTLQFDGKPIKTNDDVSEFVKADVAKHRALITVLEAKDVDTAINRIKEVIRVAADRDAAVGGDVPVANARYSQELRSKNRSINEKAVEWLEENRDKFSLKEPDVTHNYVIFDPKNLNPVHRERNMPKGYI